MPTSLGRALIKIEKELKDGRIFVAGSENSGKEHVAYFLAHACKKTDEKDGGKRTDTGGNPIIDAHILVNPRFAPRGIIDMFDGFAASVDGIRQDKFNMPVGGNLVYATFDHVNGEKNADVEEILKSRGRGRTFIIANTANNATPPYAGSADILIKVARRDFDGAPIREGEVITLGKIEEPFYFTLEDEKDEAPAFGAIVPQELEWDKMKGNYMPIANYGRGWASTGSVWLDWIIGKNMGMPEGGSALIDIGEGLGEAYWPLIINYSKNAAAIGAGVKPQKIDEEFVKSLKLPDYTGQDFEPEREEGVIKICSPGTVRQRVKMIVNKGLTPDAIKRIRYIELGEKTVNYDSEGELPVGLNVMDDENGKASEAKGARGVVELIEPFRNDKKKRLAIDVSADTMRLHYGDKSENEISRLREYAAEHGDTVLVYDKNCGPKERKAYGENVVVLRSLSPGIMLMRNPNKTGGWYAAEFRNKNGTIEVWGKHIR